AAICPGPARPISVERDPNRQLHDREREEVDRSKQSQVGRTQVHARGKLSRDDGIDRAVEVREKITGGERKQDQKDWASISDERLRGLLIRLRQRRPVHANPNILTASGTSRAVRIALSTIPLLRIHP